MNSTRRRWLREMCIRDRYEDTPFILLELDQCYQMATRAEYAQVIRQALEVKNNTPLSQAALEVLAIIAYNPVSYTHLDVYKRQTLFYLREILQKRNPASIRIATLLNKPARREADIVPDYSCFEVPDEFVVGYGLDYAEKYRNLPYIGVLKPEVYTK